MSNLKTVIAAATVAGAALVAAAQVPGPANGWLWANFDPPNFAPPEGFTGTKPNCTGVTATWPAAGFDQNLGALPGKLRTLTYSSRSARPKFMLLPVNRQVVVYTPPGYSPTKTYPVLYLLHGRGGDQTDWADQGSVGNILDNLLNAKKIVPMIVVMPDNHGIAESESDEADADADEEDGGDRVVQAYLRFETELLTELIPFIDGRFPTIRTAQGRAIAGLSEGAEQALAFGLANLDVFSRVGAFSPGADLIGGNAHDFIPDALYAEGGPLPSLLWLSCGASDTYHLNVTDSIGKNVDGVATDTNGQPMYGTLLPGTLLNARGEEAKGMSFYWRIFYADGNPDHTDAHDWNVWKASLCRFLKRVGQD